MCRFILYQGPPLLIADLVTEPSNSIIHQSFHSEERSEPLNGDGFGLAWYVPEDPEPAQFRSVTPAWSNQNLRRLASKLHSRTILAHVRAASTGLSVSEANTHPFCWDRLSFMHNGELGGFTKARRRLMAELGDQAFDLVQGTTDSEYLFAVYTQFWSDSVHTDPAERLAHALTDTLSHCVRTVGYSPELSYLNVAVSDGRASVISRVTNDDPENAESLHFHTGRAYVCFEGVCRMIAPDEQGHAVIVASERLSEEDGWGEVPPNHMIVVHPDRRTELRPVVL